MNVGASFRWIIMYKIKVLTVLDTSCFDEKKTKLIVAIKPKSLFKPIFQAADYRKHPKSVLEGHSS
jgi:hypothetical protein